jgi:hypothetical protein
MRFEPIPQGQEFGSNGAEGPHLLTPLAALVRNADTGSDALLVHVQAAPALYNALHNSPPCVERRGRQEPS